MIPVSRLDEARLEFLSHWKNTISGLHAIFVFGESIPFLDSSLPDWLESIVYTPKDIRTYLESDSWLINCSSTSSLRSFGYLVSDRKFIFTLDPQTRPIVTKEGDNLIESHLHNLLTPAVPRYFNTLYDPFAHGNTPYSSIKIES